MAIIKSDANHKPPSGLGHHYDNFISVNIKNRKVWKNILDFILKQASQDIVTYEKLNKNSTKNKNNLKFSHPTMIHTKQQMKMGAPKLDLDSIQRPRNGSNVSSNK